MVFILSTAYFGDLECIQSVIGALNVRYDNEYDYVVMYVLVSNCDGYVESQKLLQRPWVRLPGNEKVGTECQIRLQAREFEAITPR